MTVGKVRDARGDRGNRGVRMSRYKRSQGKKQKKATEGLLYYDVNVALEVDLLMALTAFYPTVHGSTCSIAIVQHCCFLPMTLVAAFLSQYHHKRSDPTKARGRKLIQHPALNQTRSRSVLLCSAPREVNSPPAISTQASFITLLTQALVYLLSLLHRSDCSFTCSLTRETTTS